MNKLAELERLRRDGEGLTRRVGDLEAYVTERQKRYEELERTGTAEAIVEMDKMEPNLEAANDQLKKLRIEEAQTLKEYRELMLAEGQAIGAALKEEFNEASGNIEDYFRQILHELETLQATGSAYIRFEIERGKATNSRRVPNIHTPWGNKINAKPKATKDNLVELISGIAKAFEAGIYPNGR